MDGDAPAPSNTPSARELGYPESFLSDLADVGRNLPEKIESTEGVIVADWKPEL